MINDVPQVEVRSGSWIDAIQFTYGTTATPWRGGTGGGLKPAFVLGSNEWITQAWVRSGAYIDEIRFLTNTGRYWSSSGDTSQSGDMGGLASPCPSGAYRWVQGAGRFAAAAMGHAPAAYPGLIIDAINSDWHCSTELGGSITH